MRPILWYVISNSDTALKYYKALSLFLFYHFSQIFSPGWSKIIIGRPLQVFE